MAAGQEEYEKQDGDAREMAIHGNLPHSVVNVDALRRKGYMNWGKKTINRKQIAINNQRKTVNGKRSNLLAIRYTILATRHPLLDIRYLLGEGDGAPGGGAVAGGERGDGYIVEHGADELGLAFHRGEGF